MIWFSAKKHASSHDIFQAYIKVGSKTFKSTSYLTEPMLLDMIKEIAESQPKDDSK